MTAKSGVIFQHPHFRVKLVATSVEKSMKPIVLMLLAMAVMPAGVTDAHEVIFQILRIPELKKREYRVGGPSAGGGEQPELLGKCSKSLDRE
jgi:hypothetical protein